MLLESIREIQDRMTLVSDVRPIERGEIVTNLSATLLPQLISSPSQEKNAENDKEEVHSYSPHFQYSRLISGSDGFNHLLKIAVRFLVRPKNLGNILSNRFATLRFQATNATTHLLKTA